LAALVFESGSFGAFRVTGIRGFLSENLFARCSRRFGGASIIYWSHCFGGASIIDVICLLVFWLVAFVGCPCINGRIHRGNLTSFIDRSRCFCGASIVDWSRSFCWASIINWSRRFGRASLIDRSRGETFINSWIHDTSVAFIIDWGRSFCRASLIHRGGHLTSLLNRRHRLSLTSRIVILNFIIGIFHDFRQTGPEIVSL